MIEIKANLTGSILDIGGVGEAVIGQIMTRKVGKLNYYSTIIKT